MDLLKIKEHYKNLNTLNLDINNPILMGWQNSNNQETRWDILISEINKCESILDWGCGYGFLLPYLRKYGYMGYYNGIDCRIECINIANKIHKKNFIYDLSPVKKYDWIISSGLFNIGYNYEDIVNILEIMNEKSDVGVAFNFLKNDFKCYKGFDENIIKNICVDIFDRNIIILNDYIDNDTTFIIK